MSLDMEEDCNAGEETQGGRNGHDGRWMYQTSKVTRAMTAGVSVMLWESSDIVKVLESWEAAGD